MATCGTCAAVLRRDEGLCPVCGTDLAAAPPAETSEARVEQRIAALVEHRRRLARRARGALIAGVALLVLAIPLAVAFGPRGAAVAPLLALILALFGVGAAGAVTTIRRWGGQPAPLFELMAEARLSPTAALGGQASRALGLAAGAAFVALVGAVFVPATAGGLVGAAAVFWAIQQLVRIHEDAG